MAAGKIMSEIVDTKRIPLDPDYIERQACRNFFRASYTGGAKYKKALDCDMEMVLVQHEGESNIGFNRRRRLTAYRNYPKLIVNKFNNFIFTSPIIRDKSNEEFNDFAKDVNTMDASLHDFIKKMTLDFQIEGESWAMMDTLSHLGASQQDAVELGDRFFCLRISTDAIIRTYEIEEDIKEVLIKVSETESKLYDNEFVTLIMTDKSGNVTFIGAPMEHGFKEIPIIRMGNGESPIDSIAEISKLIFNLDSLCIEELGNSTFTSWFFTGINADMIALDSESIKPITLGGRKVLCTNTSGQDFKEVRLTAETSQADSIRASIKDWIGEVFRNAGLHNPDVVQNTESGRALKLRMNEVALTAAALADLAEKSENKVIRLWNTGNSGEPVGPSDYPEEFDTEDLVVELESTLKIIEEAFLPSNLKRMMAEKLSKKLFPLMSNEDREKIQKELDELFGDVAEQKEGA